MQDAMTIFTCQSLNHSTLTRSHSVFINKPPVPFVEVECLLTGDHILGITIPCDQSELGEIPNYKGADYGSHETIIHHLQEKIYITMKHKLILG